MMQFMIYFISKLFFGTSKKINVPKTDGGICIADVKISKGLPVNSNIIHNLPDGRIVSKLYYIKII